eukprot:gene10647-13044_t
MSEQEQSNTPVQQQQSTEQKPNLFNNIAKKFTIPPPPKTFTDAIKRDYLILGGLGVTCAMLAGGFYNHMKGGNPKVTGTFLRLRIWAQSLTVGVMAYYAFTYQKKLDEEANRKVILT